jgi:hypothetical protein
MTPDEQPINPYAAPEAPIGEPLSDLSPELAEAEATRRKYLSHEASVKSIGSLCILGGVFQSLALVFWVVQLASGAQSGPGPFGVLGFNAAFAALYFGLGIGLIRLQNWARWVAAILTGLGLLVMLAMFGLFGVAGPGGETAPMMIGVVVGVLIYGYILYLLISRKGSVVFSPEYRRVMEMTPHIKYKTSCVVKGFLGLVFVLIAAGIIAALFGSK